MYATGYLNHVVIIKIQAGDCVAGARLSRLFLNADRPALAVEFHNTVTLGVLNVVGKDRGARLPHCGMAQFLGEASAVENIVTQYEGYRGVRYEIRA